MIDGLREYRDNLPLGLRIEVADELERLRTKIETLNSEQESLRAELKKRTEVLDKEISIMNKLYSSTKKRVKLDIEPSLWRKFGIEDKK